MKLKIKKLHEEAVVPSYAHPGDAGVDLYATKEYRVKSGEIVLVETGIAMELPRGTVGLIWDKSGFATKNGFKTLGGVVDEGYRGEIKVGLINLSKKSYLIEKGDKVAQMLIQKVEHPTITLVKKLSETKRGIGGFGSTGRK